MPFYVSGRIPYRKRCPFKAQARIPYRRRCPFKAQVSLVISTSLVICVSLLIRVSVLSPVPLLSSVSLLSSGCIYGVHAGPGPGPGPLAMDGNFFQKRIPEDLTCPKATILAFPGFLVTNCKYHPSSSNDYHCKNRTEILCTYPCRIVRDLFPRPGIFGNF